MVLNSQIRKVVLRCVTGVTPNKNVITGHYIARSGKLERILGAKWPIAAKPLPPGKIDLTFLTFI